MAIQEVYVVGRWVRGTDDEGRPHNEMSLSIDHPALLGITDATDQSGILIADGHQCVFRVTCTDKQLAALQADPRYTVFPVDGEPTLSEKLALQKYDDRIVSLPSGVQREQIKDILVAQFRLQGLQDLADQELAHAIAAEEKQRAAR